MTVASLTARKANTSNTINTIPQASLFLFKIQKGLHLSLNLEQTLSILSKCIHFGSYAASTVLCSYVRVSFIFRFMTVSAVR